MRARYSSPDPDTLLAQQDVPCPGCGHSLRGLSIDLCPECGCPFDRQALAFVSSDLGLGFMAQTPLALAMLLLANTALVLEMRSTAQALDPAAATLPILILIARGAFLASFLIPAGVCLYYLAGEPTINPRQTIESLSTGVLGRRSGAEQVAWATAWVATAINAFLMVVGWL